jgi:hypothetical protein
MVLEPRHLVTLLLLLVAAGRCLAATGVGDGGLQFTYNGFGDANLTLDGAAIMVKTNFQSDKWLQLQSFLNF